MQNAGLEDDGPTAPVNKRQVFVFFAYFSGLGISEVSYRPDTLPVAEATVWC